MYVHTDVTAEDDVRAAVDLAVSRFGRIDCMYNNAGVVGAVGSITQIPYEAWQRTIAVLLSSVFLGIKHAGAAMIAQGGGGSIISTSSTAGILGGLGPHVYTAAKHGVIGLSKSAANELAPHGIRVNAISPGATATPLIANVVTGDHTAIAAAEQWLAANAFLGYPTLAVDIANAAVYLAGDESHCVTGHTLVVDQGSVTSGIAVNQFHVRAGEVIAEAGRSTPG